MCTHRPNNYFGCGKEDISCRVGNHRESGEEYERERERGGGRADGKRKRLSPHRKYDEDDKLNPGAVRRVA